MKFFFAAAVALGAVIGVELDAGFGQGLLLLIIGFCLLAPLAISLGTYSLIVFRRGTWPEWLSRFWRAMSIAVAVMVSSWGIGKVSYRWHRHEMHVYVQRAVPILDQIYQAEGRYPAELPVSRLGPPPKWLRDPSGYFGKDDTYTFWTDDPASMGLAGWCFESDKRRWVRYY